MPAERSGVSGNFCSFTSFTETVGKPGRKLLQHNVRRRLPQVPARVASSRKQRATW